MVKRLAYIFFLLLIAASQVSAKSAGKHSPGIHSIKFTAIIHDSALFAELQFPRDTIKVKTVPQANHMDVIGKKIKEVAKPKHQSKPEKVVTPTTTPAPADTAAANKKARRQRRPEGLERPPELPRRGGN